MKTIEIPKTSSNIETADTKVLSNILLPPRKPYTRKVIKQSFKNRNALKRKHIVQQDICRR